jgi:hypothetical protein
MNRLLRNWGAPKSGLRIRTARLAIVAALVSGGVFAGMTALLPVSQAAGAGIAVGPTGYGKCAPPSVPTLDPPSSDRVFFDYNYFDNVDVAANPPISSLPNAGCGAANYQLFGFTAGTSATPIVSTTVVLADGTLIFQVPQVPCGNPFSLYATSQGITGSSAPSNVLTITPPCFTAITSAQQAQGLLIGGRTLYYNDPALGAVPVTLPGGPSGVWASQAGPPLPAGTGIFQLAGPPPD